MDEEIRKGFMDKVDFDYELEHNIRGNKVFPSVEALKEGQKCADECGIVEVEIKLIRIVQEEKPFSERKMYKPRKDGKGFERVQ